MMSQFLNKGIEWVEKCEYVELASKKLVYAKETSVSHRILLGHPT